MVVPSRVQPLAPQLLTSSLNCLRLVKHPRGSPTGLTIIYAMHVQQQTYALIDSYRQQQADITSATSEEEPSSDFSFYRSSASSWVGSDSGSD